MEFKNYIKIFKNAGLNRTWAWIKKDFFKDYDYLGFFRLLGFLLISFFIYQMSHYLHISTDLTLPIFLFSAILLFSSSFCILFGHSSRNDTTKFTIVDCFLVVHIFFYSFLLMVENSIINTIKFFVYCMNKVLSIRLMSF